jgi:hypothetical protein
VPIVRRTVSAAATIGLVASGLVILSTGVAEATVTSPASGATLRGDVTLSDSGGYDDSTFNHCGSSAGTKIDLLNSSGTIVFSASRSGEGVFSVPIRTENYPNGNYTVRGTDYIGKNGGFLGFGCKQTTSTDSNAVTIDNFAAISYSGDTSGPQGESATVRATLTDPNLNSAPLPGQRVTFSLSAGTSVSATTNSSGVATASLPIAGPPRTASLTASFTATSFYRAASKTVTFTVEKDHTRTVIATPAATVHGQPARFSATVTPTEGSGVPTGTVQFSIDGANYGAAVTLVNGVATTPYTSTLSTANHVVDAHYNGDSNFLPSDAAPVTQTVKPAATSTTLDSSVDPSVYGQPVTFTATVAVAAPGAGTPTGSVQFDVDGTPYGVAVPMTGTTASLTISSLGTGNHDVTATYIGNDDFAPSTSTGLTQGVDMAASAVSVSSSDPTAVFGEPVRFTATVSAVGPGAGTPTGSVQFAVDGAPLGDPVQLTGGTATSPATSTLAVGPHTVSVGYAGDANFSGSTGTLQQGVGQAQTSTTASSDVDPSVFGQPVTFTAQVTPVAPGAGTPDGTVQFYVDGVPVGMPVTLVGGTAVSAPVSDLATGDHAVTASYSGSDSFVASASAAFTQTVNRAHTATTLVSSANPSVFGQPVTFTATVTVVAPGAGSPTGTITFSDGAMVLATVPVGPDTAEQASFTTEDLAVAQHAISAAFSGDGSFEPSTGSIDQTVLKAQTATLLTSSANPATSGQSITFSAAVTPVAPGAGNPTGTVSFTVNGAPLGSPAPVVDGVATSTAFATLSPGTYQIAAQYSGDGDFVGSSATLDQGSGQVVAKGATAMTLTVSPNPATYGGTVTFTAVVSAVAPATGTPSGVVQFYDDDVLLGAVSLQKVSTGTATASFAASSLATGAHSVHAVYVGNFNFTGSSQTAALEIGTAATVTGVTAAPNPATYGQAVTLTATVAAAQPAPSAPTGTVTFSDDGAVLGTAPVQATAGGQQATLTVPSFEPGSHPITATYSGDGAFAGSTSPAYTLDVARAPSTLVAATLITGGSQGIEGNGGRVRATLTGLDGVPLAGQELVFTTTQPTDHSTIHICTVVTDANGFASCDSTTLITAIIIDSGYDVNFAGNAEYLPSHDHGVYSGGN